jgi:hypothetical protein
MGYYTWHELEVYDIDMNFLDEETEKHMVLISTKVLGDPNNSDLFNDHMKWYECEKDMLKHSIEYPDYIFRLYGEGEERDDNWIHYYKNGKIEKYIGEIVFSKFEISKLL